MSHSAARGAPLAQMIGDTVDAASLRAVLRTIELRLAELEKANGLGYTVTNHVERRTMDEAVITLPQLANLVGTLLKDMLQRKRLSGTVT